MKKQEPLQLTSPLSYEELATFPTLGEIKTHLSKSSNNTDFQTTNLWRRVESFYHNAETRGNKMMLRKVKYWKLLEDIYLIPNMVEDKITAATILWVTEDKELPKVKDLESFTFGLIRDNNPSVIDENEKGFLGLKRGLVNDLPVIDTSSIFTDILRVLGKEEPTTLCSSSQQVYSTKMRKINLSLSGIDTTCFSDDSMVSIMTQSTNIDIHASDVSIAILGDDNHIETSGRDIGFQRVADTGERNTIITRKQSTFITSTGTGVNITTHQDHAMIANASSQSNFILKGVENKLVDLGVNNMVKVEEDDESEIYIMNPIKPKNE